MLIKVAIIIVLLSGSILGLNYLAKQDFVSKVTPGVTAKVEPGKSTGSPRVNEEKMLKLLGILAKRPALSVKDKAAKTKIINNLANEKSHPYTKKFDDFTIDYVKSADEFLVEIKSLNTQRAKYWATMWFKLSGISDEGLCKLPVMFYLESDLKNRLQVPSLEFNPIPDNC